MTRQTGKRKFKVYHDEIKTRHTSHWDWDYMSTEEYEALMSEQRDRDRRLEQKARSKRFRNRLLAAIMAAVVVLGVAGWRLIGE